jgi:AcrR family transcriptional regulator
VSADAAGRTVVWRQPDPPGGPTTGPTGLREQKKARQRQSLTDTATELFLERGFDAVKVTEVAAACQVSEKTVYNYFPTKEALVLDRWDVGLATLPDRLADRSVDPVQAALDILEADLAGLISWLDAQPDRTAAVSRFRRFGTLLDETPALRSYQLLTFDRVSKAVAAALERRLKARRGSPLPRILATSLLGLWSVQADSLDRHLGLRTSTALARNVRADVDVAVQALRLGLDGALASTRGAAASATSRSSTATRKILSQ